MIDRRDFLKLGALWLPAVAAPRVAYSFLRAREPYVWVPVLDDRRSPKCGEGDIWVNPDIGTMIARSLERSIRDGFLAPDWASRIVITGTVSI